MSFGVSAVPDPIVRPQIPRSRGAVPRSTTWWGRAWVRGFEEIAVDAADLGDGRSLARSGRLGAVVVIAGMASVVVDARHDEALMAQVRVGRLDERSWETFVVEVSREAGHLAALESGSLPGVLVEAADDAGAELLPGPADLETACECDAWAQPCTHALALLYQLAWHIDADPYVLLLLRGWTRERLIEATERAHGLVESPDPGDVGTRAAAILDLAEDAPVGHGLADAAVAAYDEEVSRLLGD